MSSSVNVTQLRQNLGEYLKQIREGKEVEVTMHGKVIARLLPQTELRLTWRQAHSARRLSLIESSCSARHMGRTARAPLYRRSLSCGRKPDQGHIPVMGTGPVIVDRPVSDR